MPSATPWWRLDRRAGRAAVPGLAAAAGRALGHASDTSGRDDPDGDRARSRTWAGRSRHQALTAIGVSALAMGVVAAIGWAALPAPPGVSSRPASSVTSPPATAPAMTGGRVRSRARGKLRLHRPCSTTRRRRPPPHRRPPPRRSSFSPWAARRSWCWAATVPRRPTGGPTRRRASQPVAAGRTVERPALPRPPRPSTNGSGRPTSVRRGACRPATLRSVPAPIATAGRTSVRRPRPADRPKSG